VGGLVFLFAELSRVVLLEDHVPLLCTPPNRHLFRSWGLQMTSSPPRKVVLAQVLRTAFDSDLEFSCPFFGLAIANSATT